MDHHGLGNRHTFVSDAPLEFRNSLADEEDPTPPAIVTPPSFSFDGEIDPDELLGLSQAYAGQVMLMDLCLGALLDAIDASPVKSETLLIVTSPRGFPLGEHGVVGDGAPCLNEEAIHVPLMLRTPGDEFASVRNRSLASGIAPIAVPRAPMVYTV